MTTGWLCVHDDDRAAHPRRRPDRRARLRRPLHRPRRAGAYHLADRRRVDAGRPARSRCRHARRDRGRGATRGQRLGAVPRRRPAGVQEDRQPVARPRRRGTRRDPRRRRVRHVRHRPGVSVSGTYHARRQPVRPGCGGYLARLRRGSGGLPRGAGRCRDPRPARRRVARGRQPLGRGDRSRPGRNRGRRPVDLGAVALVWQRRPGRRAGRPDGENAQAATPGSAAHRLASPDDRGATHARRQPCRAGRRQRCREPRRCPD